MFRIFLLTFIFLFLTQCRKDKNELIENIDVYIDYSGPQRILKFCYLCSGDTIDQGEYFYQDSFVSVIRLDKRNGENYTRTGYFFHKGLEYAHKRIDTLINRQKGTITAIIDYGYQYRFDGFLDKMAGRWCYIDSGIPSRCVDFFMKELTVRNENILSHLGGTSYSTCNTTYEYTGFEANLIGHRMIDPFRGRHSLKLEQLRRPGCSGRGIPYTEYQYHYKMNGNGDVTEMKEIENQDYYDSKAVFNKEKVKKTTRIYRYYYHKK